MIQERPVLFISKYTLAGGQLLYVVYRHSMMVTNQLTDKELALSAYRRHREDRSLSHYHEGQRVYHAPEQPQVWDGDVAEWGWEL